MLCGMNRGKGGEVGNLSTQLSPSSPASSATHGPPAALKNSLEVGAILDVAGNHPGNGVRTPGPERDQTHMASITQTSHW